MKRILLFVVLISITICLQAQNSLVFRLGGTLPMGKWAKCTQNEESFCYFGNAYPEITIGSNGGGATLGGMFEIGIQSQIKNVKGLNYTISVAGSINSVKKKVKRAFDNALPQNRYFRDCVVYYGEDFEKSFHNLYNYHTTTIFIGISYEYAFKSDWSIFAEGGVGLGITGTNYKITYDNYKKSKSSIGMTPCFKLNFGVTYKQKIMLGIMLIDMGRIKVGDPLWWDEESYHYFFSHYDSYFDGMKQVSLCLNIGYKLNFKNK